MPGGGGYIGRWVVPLRIDGRAASIGGGLWRAGAPSLVWFWPAVVLVVSTLALVRIRRPRIDALVTAGLVSATLVAALVGQIGRELYGRPDVTTGQLVSLGVTCVLALAAVRLATLPDWRLVGVLLVAAAGGYVGLTLFDTLTQGAVLSALPAAVERAAASVALGGGVATALLVVAGGVRPFRSEARSSARSSGARTVAGSGP